MDPRIYTLLERTIHSAHGEALDQPLKDKMIVDLNLQLEQQLHDVITTALTPEDQEIYQLMEENITPQAEVERFLHERIPNVDQLLGDAMAIFVNDYVEFIKAKDYI